MESEQHGILVQQIVNLAKSIGYKSFDVTPDTNLLTDIDFDSLHLLEFLTELKKRYGVDFLRPPLALSDLKTAREVATIVCRAVRPE